VCRQLCSVGLDVGTTTTQLVVSELTVENRASGFAVPRMHITARTIRYCSDVYFTPLLGHNLVDGQGIRKILEQEYARAGITPQTVDTGAVIITGETSRKENARQVLDALTELAGDFVVATAGPHLESVLAARGAGAVAYSEKTGKRVLHMDIGGGTSNLALIENGVIVRTGCMNVGGRLIKTQAGCISYLSPVLEGLTDLQVGQLLTESRAEAVALLLVKALEMAAGLRQKDALWEKLVTYEAADTEPVEGEAVISFSGGVAECIEKELPYDAFGDIGPALGKAIRKSRLCQNEYTVGEQTIRATVIGAGCHSAQLSGSTVFCHGAALPVKNLPAVVLTEKEQTDPSAIRRKLAEQEAETVVLALPGFSSPSYTQVQTLARAVLEGVGQRPVYVCLEADMAKALGNCLCLQLSADVPCLCIDGVKLTEEAFLDVGSPVGPAFPVVVKTLILSE